jgi:hypothetical protein
MATLSQILEKKWPGSEQSLTLGADLYAGLVWLSATAKPTEQEIRAFSVEVDAILAAEAAAIHRQKELSKLDAVFQAFEVLAAAVDDLQTRAAVTGQVATRVDTLRARLAEIRAS